MLTVSLNPLMSPGYVSDGACDILGQSLATISSRRDNVDLTKSSLDDVRSGRIDLVKPEQDPSESPCSSTIPLPITWLRTTIRNKDQICGDSTQLRPLMLKKLLVLVSKYDWALSTILDVDYIKPLLHCCAKTQPRHVPISLPKLLSLIGADLLVYTQIC
ncbi:hypothetical protein BLNAU_6043 [Blattamonas nauphoetae]|uniref:Uncharacterized protein n=1 Tax=Blattamonas nauphoetae TaxID=2049346 RepID=A0ABQ9Y5K2_9EUKA|nr:hypothetical protein BLNAU_6043 [Blattamonas nauphoetae]